MRMMAGRWIIPPGAFRNATQVYSDQLTTTRWQKTLQQARRICSVLCAFANVVRQSAIYMKEQECTDFITKVPTTFDETVPLNGKVGEYVAIARRKSNEWFVGAMTNWTPRELTLDFSFLPQENIPLKFLKMGECGPQCNGL
jgi:alpha-glucosidase